MRIKNNENEAPGYRAKRNIIMNDPRVAYCTRSLVYHIVKTQYTCICVIDVFIQLIYSVKIIIVTKYRK